MSLDGELLFSKASTGRHADKGEVHALVTARLGPPLVRDEFH